MSRNVLAIGGLCALFLAGGLAFLLGGPLHFGQAAAGSAPVLRGRVVDSYGRPVAGARVRIMGGDEAVTTNNEGRFSLPMDDPSLALADLFLTAGKEGWFNGGTIVRAGNRRGIRITMQRVPRLDQPGYQPMITSPITPAAPRQRRDCANCHTTHMWEWGTSKMGKTVRNQRVLDRYRILANAGAARSGVCADCHAPIAALRAPGRTDLDRAFAGGNLSNGIECDFCHKIRQVEVGNRPGVQAITMNRVSLGGGMMAPLLVYGPYDDVVNMPMAASYNPLFEQSEFCSSCHQSAVTLPAGRTWNAAAVYPEAAVYPLYEGGRVIPEQWTYQEWLEWQRSLPADDEDKGRQCQDCHMNWTRKMLPYYRYTVSGAVRQQMGVERSPKTIYPHRFDGASPTRLAGAVNLEAEGDLRDGLLAVRVGVTNVNAGHRLPTGETSRNMILLVTAEQEDGTPLALVSGPRVPAWGGKGCGEHDYAGRPGKGFARITADGSGRLNVPVEEAVRIVSDNRIKAKATDTSYFRFALPPDADDDAIYYVNARLVYRRAFPAQERAMGWSRQETLMKEASLEIDNGDGGL